MRYSAPSITAACTSYGNGRGSLTVRPRLPWSLQHYRASRERAPSATNATWAENAADCRSSTLTPGFHVGGIGPCTARAETLGEFLDIEATLHTRKSQSP